MPRDIYNTPYIPQESVEQPRFSRRQLVGMFAAAAATGMAGGAGVATVQERQRAHERHVETLPEELQTYVSDICEHPETIPWIGPLADQSVPDRLRYQYDAQSAGLELLSTDEAHALIESAQTIEGVLEGFEAFTEQCGATVTLANNWQFPVVRAHEKESAYYKDIADMSNLGILKHRFHRMVDGLHVVPRELFTLSGLNAVHFTEFTASRIKTSGSIEVSTVGEALMDGSGRINLSLDALFRGESVVGTVTHELGHLIDFELSGGLDAAYSDEEFQTLNHPDFAYTGVYDPRAARQGGLIRAYSGVSILEDKAVHFESMLLGVRSTYAEGSGVIRDKHLLLLGRLEQAVQNMAPYLVSVGYYRRQWPKKP